MCGDCGGCGVYLKSPHFVVIWEFCTGRGGGPNRAGGCGRSGPGACAGPSGDQAGAFPDRAGARVAAGGRADQARVELNGNPVPRKKSMMQYYRPELCHILCHICGTCGTHIKCATLCGTCKWDPLDNCNFILYHSWWKVDPLLLLRLLMFWEWFVLN